MSHLIKLYAVCKCSYFRLWYLKRFTPTKKGGNDQNDRVASPGTVSIHKVGSCPSCDNSVHSVFFLSFSVYYLKNCIF